MRLPSKPYANLPIYSLGSTTTLPRDRVAALGKAASIAGPAAAVSAEKGKATVKAAATAAAAAGPSRAAAAPKPEKPSTSHHRLSLQKTMSK